MRFNCEIMSGGATLAADVVGKGDPVVFLHAAVCDRRMWRAQLDGVGAGGKAIAYDRRGFGESRADNEDFSATADLMAVIEAVADGKPVILVGCSDGGRIAIDAVLRHPSIARALVLIAPSVTGTPEPAYPPEIKNLISQMKKAQNDGDLDKVIAIKAQLFLNGPSASEDRVGGRARELFFDMNAIALRSPPIGANLDTEPAFNRLRDISVPSLVICGDLDFPNIRERSRYVAETVLNGWYHELVGAAHLPSLERPMEITSLLAEFISRRAASGEGSFPSRCSAS